MQYLPLRSYDRYIEAHLRLQQLEAEGIRAVLQDEYTVTIDPFLTNAVGGIKLMVPDVQWERALSIIEQLEAAYHQSLSCPQCGSFALQTVSDTRKTLNWFAGIRAWFHRHDKNSPTGPCRCSTCGVVFTLPDEPMEG